MFGNYTIEKGYYLISLLFKPTGKILKVFKMICYKLIKTLVNYLTVKVHIKNTFSFVFIFNAIIVISL